MSFVLLFDYSLEVCSLDWKLLNTPEQNILLRKRRSRHCSPLHSRPPHPLRRNKQAILRKALSFWSFQKWHPSCLVRACMQKDGPPWYVLSAAIPLELDTKANLALSWRLAYALIISVRKLFWSFLFLLPAPVSLIASPILLVVNSSIKLDLIDLFLSTSSSERWVHIFFLYFVAADLLKNRLRLLAVLPLGLKSVEIS